MIKNTNKPTITGVVIARNEEKMILHCLLTLQWCDKLLVIDNGSTDSTADIAEKAGAKVISFKADSFSRVRDEALKHVSTDWLVYVDADERITPTLAKEIAVHTETNTAAALTFSRKNYFFGFPFSHGGWEDDTVTRAFRVASLEGWSGDIHESARWKGENVLLHSPLVHFTHRSVVENIRKSAEWTPMEAAAFIEAKIPPVEFKTILRKGILEFWRRAIRDKGYKDGTVGLIESLVQAMNRMWVYIQIWELQQEPSIADRYTYLEDEIQKKWQKDS